MTDRIKGYIVTLEQDIREDDAEHITNAIRMISGVLSVAAIVGETGDHIIRERLKRKLMNQIMDVAENF